MAVSNTGIIIFLCLIITLELYLIDLKWTDPDTVSDIFTMVNSSIGLSSFTGAS